MQGENEEWFASYKVHTGKKSAWLVLFGEWSVAQWLKTDVTQQKRELKVSDILMWSKLMQYIKAEGVTESGENEFIQNMQVGMPAS